MNLHLYLQNQLNHLQNCKDLVIDGDTHPSSQQYIDEVIGWDNYKNSSYYQGRPVAVSDLLDEMSAAKVDKCLIWQNPALTKYTDDQDYNFEILLKANRDIFTIGKEYQDKFLPAGWTDPKALGLEKARKLTEILVKEFGFPVVKMNPAQNSYPIDSPEVFALVEQIVALGAVPAFHFGGDTEFTPPVGLAKVASSFSHSKIIGVHMGGGGSHFVHGDETYRGAREVGLQHNNIFYVLSAIRDTHIYSNVQAYLRKGDPWAQNLNIGSDAPYGRLSWNFNGFQGMLDEINQKISITEDIRKKLMGNNLLALYTKALQKVLELNFNHVNS